MPDFGAACLGGADARAPGSDSCTASPAGSLTGQIAVIDCMRLQPCGPSMVAARNAILAADQTNNGGANRCEIWRGFAAKGLGTAAVGGAFARGDETSGFAVPLQCSAAFVFANGFE